MSAKQKPKTEPHIRHPVELLKSPAMWVLSRAAHKILMYAECQGAKFAGKKNGKLPITYESLEAQGLHTDLIPPAVNEIHALGVGEVGAGAAVTPNFADQTSFALLICPAARTARSHQRTNGKRSIPSKRPKKSPRKLAPKVVSENRTPPSETEGGPALTK